MLITGLVRHYRRCEDGGVHTGLDVTDVLLETTDSDADRSEPLVDKIRRRLAELIVGRPIERVAAFDQAIPWALSGTASAKNKQYGV
jgi:hypothetical protein